jgi:hypothetical protein
MNSNLSALYIDAAANAVAEFYDVRSIIHANPPACAGLRNPFMFYLAINGQKTLGARTAMIYSAAQSRHLGCRCL